MVDERDAGLILLHLSDKEQLPHSRRSPLRLLELVTSAGQWCLSAVGHLGVLDEVQVGLISAVDRGDVPLEDISILQCGLLIQPQCLLPGHGIREYSSYFLSITELATSIIPEPGYLMAFTMRAAILILAVPVVGLAIVMLHSPTSGATARTAIPLLPSLYIYPR